MERSARGADGDVALAPGELFAGRYAIVMPIGKGGMGRVYLAEDTRLGGKRRALKLTRPLAEESRAFLPEARLLSELEHPGLPAIVDYYSPEENAGIACIVMDYIAGDTLAERFEKYGRTLPFPLVLRAVADLCDVLVYLHAQRPPVVFRDLKPANVLLDRDGAAILVDFGIARRYRASSAKDTLMLGTPGFAAPEQLRGEQSDPRTDLYGLGALAYYLLSGGRFALRRKSDMRDELQADVPEAFARLLGRMLSDDPSRRPQSAAELAGELGAIGEVVGRDQGRPRKAGSPRDDFLVEDETSRYAKRDSSVAVVAIASAYPGAGATTVALALSAALGKNGVAHALVEYPGGEAELYARLDGMRRMPGGAVFSRAGGGEAAVPAWRYGKAAYYPLDPSDSSSQEGTREAFAAWLRGLGVPVVLLDVSGGWERPGAGEWLTRHADRIVFAADCYPVKWTPGRQMACEELLREAAGRNVECDWIANRDRPFRERAAWLRLFPAAPAVFFPELPADRMLSALWNGEGLPADEGSAQAISAAFANWMPAVVRSMTLRAGR
ncbi:serine/threonine-protein kinase [Cohnella suwonensis]|uniref:non-specific serine/threonine protein kinase n=1 Tax=Cohnella suwonensis TaxID=696072 RepID=A0ABW0LSE9_9BACL